MPSLTVRVGIFVLALIATASTSVACKPKPATNHRATAVACSADKVKGDFEARAATGSPSAASEADAPDTAGRAGSCKTDAECTSGKNGRCAMAGGGRMAPTPSCIYDGCYVDADCGAKSACECSNGSPSDGHTCIPGNCATDADCAAGFCSPSFGSCGAYGGYEGNYCHTRGDDCTNDDECKDKPDGYCAWKPEAGEWQCSYGHCVG